MRTIRNEVEVTSRELAEAREQQAATSEILRVISHSPSDARPVFEIIVTHAVRLCEANFAFVMLHENGRLTLAARTDCTSAFAEYLRRGLEVNSETTTGRAALGRKPVQVVDFMAEAGVQVTQAHRGEDVRTVLAIPMVHVNRLLGVIAIWRREVRAFSPRQIELLQTFADQAVIAIENVRLYKELQARNAEVTEALEQQTATADILKVISSSPTDVQPVFDAIVRNATALCESTYANVFRYDGELVHFVATHGWPLDIVKTINSAFPARPNASRVAGRVILSRQVAHVEDALSDPDYDQELAHALGSYRKILGVPMLRDGVPIGAITVGWDEAGPIAKRHEDLLQTFADQAVIAIENVRLFHDLEARNRELTEALEQQTATSEILRVISRSPTDVQPVFDTICAAVLKLCSASAANVFTYDGKLLHATATSLVNPDGIRDIRRMFPRPADRGTVSGRAVLTRGVTVIEDVLLDADYAAVDVARWGFRSVLGVPLMRDGKPIGAIAVGRHESGPFPDKQVALLRMFADQAVIALENMRLIGELEAQTKQLARSVDQLQALAEVSQAVSSTLDLETVLSTIVSRATQLAGMDGGVIYEYEEAREQFHLRATDRLPTELFEALRSTFIPKGEGAIGRLATNGEPVVIVDILGEDLYQSRVREILIRYGYRSLLAVPLLREHRLLGGLVVNRKRAGAFEPYVIDLLQTFAAQSALAIQNARLFREIEDKSRQLEIASRHKSAFLANMSHELRTPLNAIIGFTRIVMRRSQDRLEPKQFENLEKILASGQNLLSLINAILDLAKVEAGHVAIAAAEIQPTLMLEQCLRTVEPLIKDGVALVRSLDGDIPPMLVDEEKLRQIVINLLSNAARFTASGTIEVRARETAGSVEIAVVDTGIGIAAEKLELIFEEFEQADAGTTREFGGTGLGLAIARRLARLMGGEIRAESKLGAGSTFTLILPLRYGPASS